MEFKEAIQRAASFFRCIFEEKKTVKVNGSQLNIAGRTLAPNEMFFLCKGICLSVACKALGGFPKRWAYSTEFPWRNSVLFSEKLNKIARILKAHLVCHLADREIGALQKNLRIKKPQIVAVGAQ